MPYFDDLNFDVLHTLLNPMAVDACFTQGEEMSCCSVEITKESTPREMHSVHSIGIGKLFRRTMDDQDTVLLR